MADCGCGAKCVKYSDASHCTRCCTGSLKRSLNTWKDKTITRGHRFLLPKAESSIYRTPMWLQNNPSPRAVKRKSESSSRRLLRDLNEIVAALDERDNFLRS
ncbi:unnamed protein product [Auanema sp. JU1783]|nr:unnamed protein product [Auanema sp. JU1783]